MARGVFTALTVPTAAQLNDCFDVPRCVLTNSADQSTATATETTLTFNTETIDIGGLHSTTTNTARITIPTGGDGMYLVTGSITWGTSATGYRSLALRLNGATTVGATSGVGDATYTCAQTVSRLITLSAGDYLELRAFQTSGGALLVQGGLSYAPFFSAVWVAVP